MGGGSNFVIERMTDVAARELDLDPLKFETKFDIGPTISLCDSTGNSTTAGNYQAVLQMALDMFDYEVGVLSRKPARAEGRHIGMDLSAVRSVCF